MLKQSFISVFILFSPVSFLPGTYSSDKALELTASQNSDKRKKEEEGNEGHPVVDENKIDWFGGA